MTFDANNARVTLDNTGVVINGVTILSQVSLRVMPDEIVSIVGRNGSGKTTLLELLAGRLKPTSGRYRLVLDQRADAPGVFYAPQSSHRGLLPRSTAADNIALAALLRDESRSDRLGRAGIALAELGIVRPSFLRIRAKFLSGGEQQIVLAARLLAELSDSLARPALVLLDEAFSALDVRARSQTALRIRAALQKAGVCAVVVSHDLDEAVILGDRVIVLGRKPGQIIANIPSPLSDPRGAVHTLSDVTAVAMKQQIAAALADGDSAASIKENAMA